MYFAAARIPIAYGLKPAWWILPISGVTSDVIEILVESATVIALNVRSSMDMAVVGYLDGSRICCSIAASTPIGLSPLLPVAEVNGALVVSAGLVTTANKKPRQQNSRV